MTRSFTITGTVPQTIAQLVGKKEHCTEIHLQALDTNPANLLYGIINPLHILKPDLTAALPILNSGDLTLVSSTGASITIIVTLFRE